MPSLSINPGETACDAFLSHLHVDAVKCNGGLLVHFKSSTSHAFLLVVLCPIGVAGTPGAHTSLHCNNYHNNTSDDKN